MTTPNAFGKSYELAPILVRIHDDIRVIAKLLFRLEEKVAIPIYEIYRKLLGVLIPVPFLTTQNIHVAQATPGNSVSCDSVHNGILLRG